jgi:hypothetical protein
VPTKKIFLFLYFSLRNPQGYPHQQRHYAQPPLSYAQFKKVFSYFPDKIHTACAKRFRRKYFVGIAKPQNAVWRHFGSPPLGFKGTKRPSAALSDQSGLPVFFSPALWLDQYLYVQTPAGSGLRRLTPPAINSGLTKNVPEIIRDAVSNVHLSCF